MTNEIKKQERAISSKVEKEKIESGIIGGLEKQVKDYTKAWKSANTQAEKTQVKRNLDEVKKKLREAKEDKLHRPK